jgi:hypothetical protein
LLFSSWALGGSEVTEAMGEQIVKNLLFLTIRVHEHPTLQRVDEKEEKETLHWLFRRLSFLLRPKPKMNKKNDFTRVCVSDLLPFPFSSTDLIFFLSKQTCILNFFAAIVERFPLEFLQTFFIQITAPLLRIENAPLTKRRLFPQFLHHLF